MQRGQAIVTEFLGFLQASKSKVCIEKSRRHNTSSEHLLCGRKLVVDECEGCIIVGDVGTNTQNGSWHLNTVEE